MPPLFQRLNGSAQSDGTGRRGAVDKKVAILHWETSVAADETDLS